ncbi:hypothetical protein [Nostoc sp.]|uniref:hypothetical protein n=1 Tax=Nostoc sp. TaxID=1180 RepID=UPI002FF002F2
MELYSRTADPVIMDLILSSFLTQHFLSTTALRREFKRLALAESAMKRLKNYTFSGNVRELQNTLERAAILSGGRTILPEHLVFSQKDEI